MTRTVSPFLTDNAGLLEIGDQFEFRLNAEDNWQCFTFYGFIEGTSPVTGCEIKPFIDCYGGDPMRAKYEYRAQWHCYYPEVVKALARPVRSTWRTKR